MPREPIIKSSPRGGVAPNLRNYEQARAAFSWEEARSELDGLPGGGGLNIAHEAVDRHAPGALHDKTAIRWFGKDGSVRDFSFAQRRNVSGRSGSIIARAGKVMTRDEIKNTVLRILGGIAPEADLTLIDPQVSFREQLDIDSMDFLNSPSG
jgi:hypothetical protein